MNHSDRKTIAGGTANKEMVWSGTVPAEIFRDRSGAALIFALLVMVTERSRSLSVRQHLILNQK
jgi:hypothetical protein